MSMLEKIAKVGIVSSVDTAHHAVRVIYPDDGTTSGWLFVLQREGSIVSVEPDGSHSHTIHDTYHGGGTCDPVPDHGHIGSETGAWMPSINNAVLILNLPVPGGDGFVLGVIP